MPRPAVTYEPRPYVRPAYEPDTRTLMDLIRLSGASRAAVEGQKGQNRAAGIFTIGKLISDALGSMSDERMQKEVIGQRQAQAEREDAFKRDQLASMNADREERRAMAEAAAREKQQADAYKRGSEMAEAVEYGPVDESQVDPLMAGPAAGRMRYAFGPGTAEGPELQPSPSQRRGIEAQKKLEGMGGFVGPNGQIVMPEKPAVTPTPESRLSGEDLLAYLAAQGNQGAINALKVKREQRPPTADKPVRQPIWVVGADGQFTDLAGVAPPGAKPANTREQGRPVTSGDANRVADLNTSLDDLKVLTEVLSGVSGSTGTSAKVGAMLPNWATELTGRGTSAKQKQATIDRVKQVIGKALEGGVLRKEDEAKYEKILPTIYDPPPIVTSKLKGLETALVQRRSVLVDALKDAGYDTAAYESRQGVTPAAGGSVERWERGPDGKPRKVGG